MLDTKVRGVSPFNPTSFFAPIVQMARTVARLAINLGSNPSGSTKVFSVEVEKVDDRLITCRTGALPANATKFCPAPLKFHGKSPWQDSSLG